MNRLKIVLVTQGVSRLVKPLYESGHEVVGILESMPRDYKGGAGNTVFVTLLKKLYSVITRRDLFLPFYCKDKQIPYNFIWKNNSDEVAEWLKSLKPDLIVVYSMSQLLKKNILQVPSLGVINLHPSFLPCYRGANPDFWQYYDMETNPGVTVHYIDQGEDTGDIIFQEKMHIPLGTKSPERLDKLVGQLGVNLTLRAINAISNGAAPRMPQRLESPTCRARNLRPEEHNQIIDWENWPIERVWHVLRGTESWLNAVAQPSGLMTGQRWSIEDYEKTNHSQAGIGTIGKYRDKSCIFTKDGVIYIKLSCDIKKTVLKLIGK